MRRAALEIDGHARVFKPIRRRRRKIRNRANYNPFYNEQVVGDFICYRDTNVAAHIGNVNWRARKIDALSYFSLRRTRQRNIAIPFVVGLCLHAADHVHVHANNVCTQRLEVTCIFVFPYVIYKRMEITASSCDTLLYILCAEGIFLYPTFFFLKVFNLVNVFRNFHIRISIYEFDEKIKYFAISRLPLRYMYVEAGHNIT